jgi:hypothetical protein
MTDFALLQDFGSSHQHPSGKPAWLLLLIKTIGMDFQDNTKVTPENA